MQTYMHTSKQTYTTISFRMHLGSRLGCGLRPGQAVLYVSLATTKGLSSCRVVRPRAFHLPLLAAAAAAAAAALAIGPARDNAPAAATFAVAVAVATAMANTTSATNSHTIGPG